MKTKLSVFTVVLVWAAVGGNPRVAAEEWDCVSAPDRLEITLGGQAVAEFVYRDPKILRPYFANLRTPGGIAVTRQHPPVVGVDPDDHATMHPGLWLALGDLNGVDFWRNRGRVEQVRFVEPPRPERDRLRFATECRLLTPAGESIGSLTNRFELIARAEGWLLVWDATFQSETGPLVFGDQEEMGFGGRVATPLIEKNGGRIRNAAGQETARLTWGEPAAWCDYSGVIGERRAGILILAAPTNFRPSWWHNRDYGLMVANPFGREAMKQGEKSRVVVSQGETLNLRYGALVYAVAAREELDRAAVYREFAAGHTEELRP